MPSIGPLFRAGATLGLQTPTAQSGTQAAFPLQLKGLSEIVAGLCLQGITTTNLWPLCSFRKSN